MNTEQKKNNIETFIQFIKFNIIGVVNTVITYLIFGGIYCLTNSKLLGLLGDYSFGILFSFFANRYFTFGLYDKKFVKQMVKMVITYIVIFFINLGILSLLTNTCMLNTYISQFIALLLITFLSFLNQRFFVFREGHLH